MALYIQPEIGSIVICDFKGYIEPEIIKVRPVVVIAKHPHNSKLITVVPLSTTKPQELANFHFEMISPIDRKKVWAKCDLIYSVSTDRLNKIKVIKGRTKTWEILKVTDTQLNSIKTAVANHLKIQHNIGVPVMGK
ncbi:type II toxin-antitoxin system PemK/MazF family toxin [Acinetobacter guillouiae]|uniref:type II toxin-antitoxin system PemK/MazF family toxin n=1 Tax=Acinetobacter guillouiae TaxID=106649 RepID=UPI003009AA51